MKKFICCVTIIVLLVYFVCPVFAQHKRVQRKALIVKLYVQETTPDVYAVPLNLEKVENRGYGYGGGVAKDCHKCEEYTPPGYEYLIEPQVIRRGLAKVKIKIIVDDIVESTFFISRNKGARIFLDNRISAYVYYGRVQKGWDVL